MIFRSLRFFAAALVVVGGSALAVSPVAAAVRPEVGNPLRDAQADAASGKCEAAKAKIEQAQGVGGKTADESTTISQMKQYVDVKCGSADSALGAKAKFAQDYDAGRYRAAIDDAALLRKYGALDSNTMLVIGQAYYKLGDYAGCVHYMKDSFGMRGGETSLELLRRCAFEIDDTATQREALEELVSTTGKSEYWDQLLETSRKTQGLKDHQTLDIYRIKFLTGSIRTPDDVKLLAELAIENGDSAEAVNVIQKSNGIAGVAGNARFQKLLATAQAQAAQDAANLQKASASGNGDTLVKLGEEQWGAGKPQDTIRLVQAGVAKGVTDKDNAAIRLGMGYLGAGQKEAAIKAFNSAKGDPKWQIIGHLWALYARK
jgi:hypothetical protein